MAVDSTSCIGFFICYNVDCCHFPIVAGHPRKNFVILHLMRSIWGLFNGTGLGQWKRAHKRGESCVDRLSCLLPLPVFVLAKVDMSSILSPYFRKKPLVFLSVRYSRTARASVRPISVLSAILGHAPPEYYGIPRTVDVLTIQNFHIEFALRVLPLIFGADRKMETP